MNSFLEKAKESGGIFPTLFNLVEMWNLNSTRCNGKFNLIFFWMYPLVAFMLMPFTLLCLVEILMGGVNNV